MPKDRDFELVLEIPEGRRLSIRDSLEFCLYDGEIFNAAQDGKTSLVAALQKRIKLKNITVRVVGGGGLDVPDPTYSVAGVANAQVVARPNIRILK